LFDSFPPFSPFAFSERALFSVLSDSLGVSLSSITANNDKVAIGGNVGRELRAAREHVGLTRAQLADMAHFAISSLGFIEQGAVPERSAVLDRAWAVIERLENERAKRA
jgi:hypothetical protein